MSEVRKHNKADDCWAVIHGKVYNLTSFLDSHPAGKKVILEVAGKDATPAFEPFHSSSIISTLGLDHLCLGEIDSSTVLPQDIASGEPHSPPAAPLPHSSPSPSPSPSPSAPSIPPFVKPSIDEMLNIFDFEYVARNVMSKQGWAYYSSGADDEITLRENHLAFQRIWLRPRVLVNVTNVNTVTTMLGQKCSFPLYITATALGKLAHPDGELALCRAARAEGIPQMLPTLASYTLDEMLAEKHPDQTQFYQLYVNSDRKVTAELIRKAEKGGCKGLFITVDAPQLGRREKDMRQKMGAVSSVQKEADSKGRVRKDQGTARALSAFIDPSLCWADLAWFKTITKLPIVLKGIQTGEDAILAVQHGMAGIVVSNHGGRQMDFGRSGIEILPEVMDALRSIGAQDKIEVYVDGGVRRGSDIFKALALGARAVGIGRPTLYGLAAFGEDGVRRVIDILREEFEMVMRLMGVTSLADINPSMASIKNLADHFAPQPRDSLFGQIYEPLKLAGRPQSRL